VGEKLGQRLEHRLSKDNFVELYYKSNPGNALEQHTYLLIRMAYQFYLAKLNQEKIRAQEHFATIHHTGARLTHDIKNILQSIKTSLDILQNSTESEKYQEILQANLTQISGRLENTLSQLKSPQLDPSVRQINCTEWIEQIEMQHQQNTRLTFSRDIEINTAIPIELFNSVVENLINNALRKKSADQVDIRLLSNETVILLSVCDNGEAIPQDIESNLFKQPVSSGSGMGIGLYQSSIMASAFNFELDLSQNETGKVCFNLYQQLEE
jgi:signal transduction histidine kinase